MPSTLLKVLLAALFGALLSPLFAEEIHLGGPVISEFLARNETGLQDEDGERPDWIEILNASETPVDLSGWHLTDDPALPTRWTFPTVTLEPRGYLVVFASGKARRSPEGPLHTNFSLAGSGEYLALRAPDGVTVAREFAPQFPPQSADQSYGFQGREQQAGFFATPTPGGENRTPIGLILQPPLLSEESQILTSRLRLEATLPPSAPPGAEIRFTTDGNNPGPASPLWSGPFRLLNATRIKAAVFDPAGLYEASEVITRHFTKVKPDLAEFSSNLPIVLVDSFGINVDGLGKTPDFTEAFSAFIDRDEATGRASLLGAPDFVGNSGIRVRGSSSAWLFPKKQYRFETWDAQGNDDDVSLFGLPAESDWVLNAPWSDKTMMRNHLAYRQGGKMGDYSPRTRFFELFLNPDGGSIGLEDYQGIYVLVERIKISGDRLDLAKLDPEDSTAPAVTGGYIIRKDRINQGDVSVTTAIERVPLLFHEPDAPTAAQRSYLRDFLNRFEGALHGPNFADPEAGFRAYIDEDSWIDHHLLTEGLRNADGFRLSTHYHKDRNGLLKAGPAWDFNLGLGNASFNGAQSPTGWHYQEMDPNRFLPPYPWYGRLFEDPAFTLAYWDRYFQIRQTQWDTPTLMAEIDEIAAYLSAEATAREFERWPTLGRQTYANAPGYQNRLTYQSEVDALKTFLSERFAWMDRQFDPPPVLSLPPGPVEAGVALAISSETPGTILYTTDGSDPADEPAAANTYQSPVLLSDSTWVKARTRRSSGRWGTLATARYLIDDLPVLSLSEIHYRPAAASPEENEAGFGRNDFEFLELHNPGATPVNLTGAEFTRGLTFTFDELILPPGGRAVLVKNPAAFSLRYGDLDGVLVLGGYQGNLDNDGETLELAGQHRRTLFSVTYNDAPPWPETADGDGPSLVLQDPAFPPNLPGSWQAASEMGGTPGRPDFPAFSGDPTGDDNRNGISNLVEYAIGVTPLTLVSLDEDFATFSFRRRPGLSGITITLQTSVDPSREPWTAFTGTPKVDATAPDGTETVHLSIPRAGKLFARLVVGLP